MPETIADILRNPVKEKLARGEVVASMTVRLVTSIEIASLAKTAGFDTLYIDVEHSSLSLATTSQICIAALAVGIAPFVRVPSIRPEHVGRVLDGGALGVIFPHVESAEQARAMAAACRYPPLGHRSVMGSGPALGYRALPLAEVNAAGNADTLLIVMLETPAGIACADAIAAVPGVDVLLIGANDLSAEMGIAGELRHARLREAFAAAAAACKAHNKVLGIGGVRGDLDLQTELFRLGGRFVIAGSDVTYLAAAASADAKALRSMQIG